MGTSDPVRRGGEVVRGGARWCEGATIGRDGPASRWTLAHNLGRLDEGYLDAWAEALGLPDLLAKARIAAQG